MESSTHTYSYDGSKSFTLIKWKIRIGTQLLYNSVILSYKLDGVTDVDGKDPLLKYRSNVAGTVVELLAAEGDTILPGAQLLKIQPCTHPVIMKDLCAECGADLRHLDRENFEKLTSATTFSMVHVVPELKVCLEQAEKLGRDDETRLLKDRKLVLLVDLDQTLIHTTNDNVRKELPDVHHFQLYGQNSPWYHTKLRPGTRIFLENISKYYELHICTFGARLYAHKIAEILDPDQKLFSHRILSRDECFDATSKTGNLKALFPRGDDMVCIIDDREDVWNFAPNVVHVKPYCYFHNTGDINAPPFVPSGSNANNASGMLINSETPVAAVTTSSNNEPGIQNVKSFENAKEISKPDQNKQVNSSISSKDNVKNKAVVCNENSEKNNGCKNESSSGCSSEESTSRGSSEESTSRGSSEESTCKCSSEESASGAEKKENKSKEALTVKTPEIEPIKPEIAVEFPPPDDYLLYLEEILQNIHKEYYKIYDKIKKQGKKGIPDLKVIVPEVKSRVLKGCNIVFSSVIPTNLHPETSRFWTLAESLGARVTLDLVLDSSENRTTHVVASKLGTAKVNTAKKHEGIFIVGLDWLFCCAERWERADERLFTLKKDVPPPFLDGGKQFEGSVENSFYDPTMGKSLKGWPGSKRSRSSGKRKNRKKADEEEFSERIFVEAGLSLSQDDIEDMDREIEEACSEESDKDSQSSDSSDSSSESLSSADYPKGWKRPKRDFVDIEENEFVGESSDADTIGSVDEEMAEAVKQEFGT